MSLELEIQQLQEFTSQEVVSQDTADVDVERFKRELEIFLQQFLRATSADLLRLCPVGYSLEEVDTGQTWIDGRTIYRKVVDLGNLPNTTSSSTPHNIVGILQVVQLWGVATSGAAGWTALPKASPTAANNIQMTIDGGTGTDVVVVTGKDESANTGFAIIEYTRS